MEENPIPSAGSRWGPPPIPEKSPDPGELAILREEILHRLDEIAALFRESHQHKDDRLLRLQELCAVEAEGRAKAILRDVTRLHDVVGRTATEYRLLPQEALSVEKILKRFHGFEEDIELLLEQHGVTIYREEGEMLMPQQQVASRIELTDDQEKVGQVAARLRPGFLYQETPLVKERVAVFAMPKAPAESRPPKKKESAANAGEAEISELEREKE